MSEDSSADIADGLLYESVGQATFAGFLAAIPALWLWGGNLLYLAFIYGISMANLCGWPELAGSSR